MVDLRQHHNLKFYHCNSVYNNHFLVKYVVRSVWIYFACILIQLLLFFSCLLCICSLMFFFLFGLANKNISVTDATIQMDFTFVHIIS